MKLVRYASLYLEHKYVPEDGLYFVVESVTVTVQDASFGGEKGRLLLQAVVNLDAWPEVDSSGVVVVPEQPRKQTERGIEHVSNLLSVLNHCRRRILSPRPFVALGLEDSRELQWSEGLSWFQGNQSSIPKSSFCLSLSGQLHALSDRLDGVELLAEALAQEHATGKFHEFMRLFERAFALPPSQFEKKLSQLLQGADLGYERSEVKEWIELRNPATHANDLTRGHIVLESHVRPVIDRLEQAAYDVLFNKEKWADSSKERRSQWRPDAATIDPKGGLRITQGQGASFTLQVLDPFKAFAYDPTFRLPQLAENLWSSWATMDDVASNQSVPGPTSPSPASPLCNDSAGTGSP